MQNIVIIGGSHGIGLEIVRHYAAAGHAVTVLSRTQELLSEVQNPSGTVKHVACDVTKDDITSDMLPETIHALAYCPGSIYLRAFASLPPEQFREDFELNLVGAVKSIQAALKGLKAVDAASIVLFSTVAVQQGMFAHASIAAAKGAVEGLTRTLAAELAPKIRVNCLAPALTETPLTERFFSKPEKAESLAKMYPLGRTGKAQDLANLACFLLGGDSSWITGQVVGVDGGMSAIRS